MEDIKNKLIAIIEQADCEKPACKNCKSFTNGKCTFGNVNERVKITFPNYSCANFSTEYNFSDSTIGALKDLQKDMNRVNEGLKNLKLLLNGKITEEDFLNIID